MTSTSAESQELAAPSLSSDATCAKCGRPVSEGHTHLYCGAVLATPSSAMPGDATTKLPLTDVGTSTFRDFGDSIAKAKPATSSAGVILLVILVVGALVTLLWANLPDSSSGGSHSLSNSTRQKLFYDMTATQDLNPNSNEWNEGVKQAAAKSYNVPMSEINDIIHEGATKGWLTPTPP